MPKNLDKTPFQNLAGQSANINKKDVDKEKQTKDWKREEEATAEMWAEKREMSFLEIQLAKNGITKEMLDTLGIEGIFSILGETTGEELETFLNKQKILEQSLAEKLQDPNIKAMVEFRIKNLKDAFKEDHQIQKEKNEIWRKLNRLLGREPVQVQRAEYEAKLEDLRQHLKKLESKGDLSIEEQNDLKKTRASINLLEIQISNLEKIRKEEPPLELKELIRKYQEKLEEIDQKELELRQKTPEAFLALNYRDFKKYTRALHRGNLVETPTVAKHIDEIVEHLKANVPVMIYGHFGSGKTELALHIAKTRFPKTKEQEEKNIPTSYVISGSKHIVPSELYGHQVLTIPSLEEGGFDEQQVKQWRRQAGQVEAEFKKWCEENPQASLDEKNRYHQTLLQLYCAQLGKGTISDFVLGPVYEAMKNGRPLIIDEVNAIPHEVLISLNYILTRKVGDKITVQQDTGKEIVIKDGFCIMMTGNLNQGQVQYIDRQEMDPAFLSRLHKVEYGYLPQEKEGPLEKKAGPKNELYQLLLAKVADERGMISAPEDTLEKLWKLAQAARVIEDVFAGKEISSAFYYQEGGGRAVKYMLKKSNLSLRELFRIVDTWKANNSKKELDYYLYKEFVGETEDLNDKAYLYQILKNQFGFFQSNGWEQNPDYGISGQINSFEIQVPENPSRQLKFFGPEEIIQAAFGKKPERKEWPALPQEVEKEDELVKKGDKLREILHSQLELTERLRQLKELLPEELSSEIKD